MIWLIISMVAFLYGIFFVPNGKEYEVLNLMYSLVGLVCYGLYKIDNIEKKIK